MISHEHHPVPAIPLVSVAVSVEVSVEVEVRVTVGMVLVWRCDGRDGSAWMVDDDGRIAILLDKKAPFNTIWGTVFQVDQEEAAQVMPPEMPPQ